jgi:hypothetical protein
MSFIEAVSNVIIGYGTAIGIQLLIFPYFDIRVSIGANLIIGAIFTVVSIARSYVVRRCFEKLRVSRSAAECLYHGSCFTSLQDGPFNSGRPCKYSDCVWHKYYQGARDLDNMVRG